MQVFPWAKNWFCPVFPILRIYFVYLPFVRQRENTLFAADLPTRLWSRLLTSCSIYCIAYILEHTNNVSMMSYLQQCPRLCCSNASNHSVVSIGVFYFGNLLACLFLWLTYFPRNLCCIALHSICKSQFTVRCQFLSQIQHSFINQ